MDKDIKEIIGKYKFSRDIKRFSLNQNNNVFFRKIESKKHIVDYQERAFGAYGVVKKDYPLHQDDIAYLKNAIVEYEVCISKGIAMSDNFMSSWDISGKELEDYIAKLFELYELYDQLVQRKLFQD